MSHCTLPQMLKVTPHVEVPLQYAITLTLAVLVDLQFILKCALARFPNQPTLMILLANLTSELKQEGQKSRTHIQIAIKNKPSLVERYFIYMSQEVAKKNKSDDSMDLVG